MKAANWRNKACYKCGETGHFFSNCINKPKGRWCLNCQNSTHDTNTYRRQGKSSGYNERINSLVNEETTGDHHSFIFKVCSNMKMVASSKPDMLLVDCGATTHILTDESRFTRFDETFKPERHLIELADGTRCRNVAVKRGDAMIKMIDSDGRHCNVKLKNTLLIPTYPQNIFSVQAATEKGAQVIFYPESAELIDKSDIKFYIEKCGNCIT
ncbi:uncharacterized protein [Palaemon carinicauda]|uniref:uncharacterized protein n=1 Tax=Palaemon carinicauda TaxID=392227 RepID=UPI0035B5C384